MAPSKSGNQLHIIEPNKCIVEDLEILAFENEEQLNYYSIWHEGLYDKRRELNAESEREKQIIRNEIARKTRALVGSSRNESHQAPKLPGNQTITNKTTTKTSPTAKASPNNNTSTNNTSPARRLASNNQAAILNASSPDNVPASPTPVQTPGPQRVPTLAFRPLSSFNQCHGQRDTITSARTTSHQKQGSALVPNGLTILNSVQNAGLSGGKQIMKYKLTKLYNKYRGRQMRRNFVNEKQRNAKIEAEVSKSYLNSWLAYTALQALRLPDNNLNTLSAVTNSCSKILTPMTQHHHQANTSTTNNTTSTNPNQIPNQQQQKPMQLVYIDNSNLITYSNRINPQQVADYKQKSHLLPSSATSKKSSAASYDVYEIMEVLANTNKTSVTITRNANRPAAQSGSGSSIYSHSVNANTPGIVSTQLHLQARYYLDTMGKFYAEEAQRLDKDREELESEPSHEEIIGRYLNVDYRVAVNE